MSFNRAEVSDLLVQIHRRCCICHRFCGVKIETDHIVPSDDGGSDEIENAIPVCFECHAEIHSYNDHHPRGRKFSPDELKRHKIQWLQTCRDHPELFVAAARVADVGPLQALLDELDFNKVVSKSESGRGAQFLDEQFRNAIGRGAIAVLEPTLKQTILIAYEAVSRANERIRAEVNQGAAEQWAGLLSPAADKAMRDAGPKITAAYDQLLSFLSSER